MGKYKTPRANNNASLRMTTVTVSFTKKGAKRSSFAPVADNARVIPAKNRTGAQLDANQETLEFLRDDCGLHQPLLGNVDAKVDSRQPLTEIEQGILLHKIEPSLLAFVLKHSEELATMMAKTQEIWC